MFEAGEIDACISNESVSMLVRIGTDCSFPCLDADGHSHPDYTDEKRNAAWKAARESQALKDAQYFALAHSALPEAIAEIERLTVTIEGLRMGSLVPNVRPETPTRVRYAITVFCTSTMTPGVIAPLRSTTPASTPSAPVDDDEGTVMASLFEELAKRVDANCTTCGTHNGCVCRKAEQTPMVCYLCNGPHDPRVAPPRVCTSCARLYLT